jgi:nucleotide-binding universal stress UspA family protein
MNINAILVATDFSECSGVAFQSAAQLAQTFEAKIILLHVVSLKHVAVLTEYLGQDADTLVPDLRERAQHHLTKFMAHWPAGKVEVETMVAVGTPFQEIAVIARELAVDLVVLGGYGRAGGGPIEEIFFGSTAEKVVRLLPCPVLCVPLTEKRPAG